MLKTDLILPYRYSMDSVKDALCEILPISKGEIDDIRLIKRELIIKDGGTPMYKSTVAFSSSEMKEKGKSQLTQEH